MCSGAACCISCASSLSSLSPYPCTHSAISFAQEVPPVTPELVPNQINLLSEQLEWLVKMGFAVEDIKKWARTKLESEDRDTTSNKDEGSTTTMQPQPCGPCGTHAGNSESRQQPGLFSLS